MITKKETRCQVCKAPSKYGQCEFCVRMYATHPLDEPSGSDVKCVANETNLNNNEMTATSMNAVNDIESQIEPEQSIDGISSPTQEASVRAKSNTSRLIDVFKRHKYTILLIGMILVSGLMVACLLMVMSRNEQSKESVVAKEPSKEIRNKGNDLPSIIPKEQSKEFVNAELAYFTEAFKESELIDPADPKTLPQLLKDEKAKKKTVPIYDVNDFTAEELDFQKTGFAFKSVQDDATLMPIIKEIRDTGGADEAEFETKLKNAIEEMLRKESGLDHKVNNPITCSVGKVRSNERLNGQNAPLSFVHVDVSPHYQDKMKRGINNAMDGAFGEITAMYNVWIPVVDELISDPLVVMDISTINEEDQFSYYHTFPREPGDEAPAPDVKIGSVRHNKGQKWYYKKGMKLGEVLIFRTSETPHSSATLLDGVQATRRSIEVRCFAHTKELPDEAKQQQEDN